MPQPGRIEPQEIPRRVALLPVGDSGMKVEVFTLARRRCFGRWDILVAPARGEGKRWVRRKNLEFIEQGQGQGVSHE